MQCSIILHSQIEKQKQVKQMQKLISGLTKKILIQGCQKKNSTNGSEIVSSKIINSHYTRTDSKKLNNPRSTS
jgi:hypothetical protein